MNDERLRRIVSEKTSRKFGSHQVLYSKYAPKIPASADREYIRIINQYMGLLKETLEEELPKLKGTYKKERDAEVRENRRADGMTDLDLIITDMFHRMERKLMEKEEGFGLRRKLELLAHLERKLTIKEWKRAVKATLGIDIREDYYRDFFNQLLDEWIEENVNLIKSIPEDTLDRMNKVIYEGYTNGRTTTDMTKEIQRAFQVGKRKARFIARDQVAKLNGKIQQAEQQDAGIREYIWDTVGDSRVRKSHRELDGKKFSWDDPPLNSDGRRCHPGEDYGCRCIGRPVFDRSTLSLPIAGEVEVRIT